MKTHHYDLHDKKYKGPVPEHVFKAPEKTLTYDFLFERIEKKRGPAVPQDLKPYIKHLVGRCLEIAILRAASPDVPADLTPLQTVSERAQKARKAIDQVVKALEAMAQAAKAPEAIDRDVKALEAMDSVKWFPLLWTRYGGKRDPSTDFLKGQADAEADLVILDRASSLLKDLASDAKRRRDEWSRQRQNTGDLSRQAFVMILAEAWLFATGRLPGGSNDPDKNPFLALVGAAWKDWHGAGADVPSFFSQAKTAAVALQNAPSWMPPRWADINDWPGFEMIRARLMSSRSVLGTTTPTK